MKVFQKKKTILIHILVMILLFFAVVKYCEEIQNLKQEVYNFIVSSGNAHTEEATEEPPEEVSEEEEIILQPAITVENPWFAGMPMIYHAGGGIGISTYTNSVEAVQATLDRGGTVFEIDFNYTSDGHLVCVHEWRDVYPADKVATLEEFRSAKVQGEYTPMTAEDLLGIMQNNPQMYVITDTKSEKGVIALAEDLLEIAQQAGMQDVLERIVFQLYSGREKSSIQALYPFSDGQFLFTLYNWGLWNLEAAKICNEENIPVITVPFGTMPKEDVELMHELGFTVYEHTVNRMDEVRNSLKRGITGFYTDFLTPEDLETAME